MAIQQLQTYCAMCVSRCGILATVEDGRLTKVTADPAHPNGCICVKGTAAPEIVYAPDRLQYPMMGVCSGYVQKVVTRHKHIKNNALQFPSITPIETKIRSSLIQCPKMVLQNQAPKALIIQAKYCARTLTEKAYFSGR